MEKVLGECICAIAGRPGGRVHVCVCMCVLAQSQEDQEKRTQAEFAANLIFWVNVGDDVPKDRNGDRKGSLLGSWTRPITCQS